MDWVSNIFLVNKKHGTICICIYYCDLNIFCPKDNYPTRSTDHIIDDYVDCHTFSFMDGFFGYNQIAIKLVDQHKSTSIFPWGMFAYRKLPFGLKNAGENFRRKMDYEFHDIK